MCVACSLRNDAVRNGAEVFVFQFAIKNLKNKMYITIILPVALYGCETWSFTLVEEYRLRVFENRVLRKIFGASGTR